MEPAIDVFLWILSLVGHLGLCCFLFNRIHATALPRSTRKSTEKLILLMAGLPLLYWLVVTLRLGDLHFPAMNADPAVRAYPHLTAAFGAYFILRRTWERWRDRRPRGLLTRKSEHRDVAAELNQPLLHGWLAQAMGRIPFNEVRRLTLERIELGLPIPPELDGLRIGHLSDLHYTGQIDRAYFDFLVDRVLEFQPDLIVITGDLVDEVPCLDWIRPSLGRLQAPLGVFYILGNHDLRVGDEARLRGELAAAGLQPAAGRWLDLDHQGRTIRLTGNELPWFPGADQLGPEPESRADLRLLISHSPDQYRWALHRDFDLMLAGHTHGGQIAFPLIGPVVSPSRYGVRFAAGTFQLGRLLMHVSRGISGDEPIRWNSPPELGLLTLRSQAGEVGQGIRDRPGR